ncbi:putative harbinger transposase-derived nuclease domain-containing protein [Arabidopsis thaliana]
MDGKHVCVKVKLELQGMYWNRHDNASLNIMAICDLNMLFTYIWNGAPGSCHDTVVLQIAQQSDSEFLLPPSEKYYLVDSGYPNKQGFLALYRSSQNRIVRCHMSQFYFGPPPRNKHELFNQCHASLRSVIERTLEFGKKNGGFFRIFQDIMFMFKKECNRYTRWRTYDANKRQYCKYVMGK